MLLLTFESRIFSMLPVKYSMLLLSDSSTSSADILAVKGGMKGCIPLEIVSITSKPLLR